MKKSLILLLFTSWMALPLTISAQVDGEALFKQNCNACHMVKSTKLVGPGLANIESRRSREWLLKFIKSSTTMISSGDPTAVAVAKEYNNMLMPDQPLSEEQINAVLDYIKAKSPAPAPGETAVADTTPAEVPTKAVADATAEDITTGEMLYAGNTRFANGGPSCMSCHNINYDGVIGGGLFAKDLTDAYSRLSEMGVRGIVGSPPFPAMSSAYKDRALTEDEVFQLAAFLQKVDAERFYQHAPNYNSRFIWTAVFGVFGLFTFFGIVWFNRKKKSVNHDIYKRQVKGKDTPPSVR